jgi:hypothetical protein
MKLLRVVPINEDGTTNEDVQYECWHPLAIVRLEKQLPIQIDQPYFCAVDYKYDSVLHEICNALGWQGGTLTDVVKEIKRLRKGDEK